MKYNPGLCFYTSTLTWKAVMPILFLCLSACEKNKEDEMVLISSGTFAMGARSNESERDEYPRHQVTVKPFYMDATEVTNAQFEKFVNETGYVTTAEKNISWDELKAQVPEGTVKPADSLLRAGCLVFKKTTSAVNLNDYSQWWSWTVGADWRHPDGPNSSIKDRMQHPVVNVSWFDAQAYAKWAGKRLPSESEWEWAASGGSSELVYPWGNERPDRAASKANFWQGSFPYENLKTDGFEGTSPVKTFPANPFGLYDIAGNVWEWCEDVYNNQGYTEMVEDNIPKNSAAVQRVLRGGSYLCNDSYCSGYRISRRMGTTPDTGLNHTGFRCVKDL